MAKITQHKSTVEKLLVSCICPTINGQMIVIDFKQSICYHDSTVSHFCLALESVR